MGYGQIRMSAGPADIAAAAKARLTLQWIEPQADGYAIKLGQPAAAPANTRQSRAMEATIQALVDATVLAQPALWEGWATFSGLAEPRDMAALA